MRKVGVQFYPGIGVDPDLTGLASTLTAKYKLEGSTAGFTAISGTFTEEYPGFYTIPLTLNAAGSYLIVFESTDSRIGIKEGYVEVSNTSIDDIKLAIDQAQNDITLVKQQVDVLDEAELNNVAEQITALQAVTDKIVTALNDTTDVYFELNGDETANLTKGMTITGVTSGASGILNSATYDATTDITKVVVNGVTGAYVVGESVNNGSVNTTGVIQAITVNIVNSVLEFVNQINETLLSGGSSLDILRKFSLDVEHMILGDATLEDGSANPTVGKGVTQIFDELVSTHTDLTALKALAEDATFGFSALKTAITNSQTAIETKITALMDETDPNSIAGRIVSVQATVDANANILGDATFGNSAIRTAIDNLAAQNATENTNVLNTLNDASTGLAAIKTAVMDQLAIMDGKLDTIISTQDASVATRIIL